MLLLLLLNFMNIIHNIIYKIQVHFPNKKIYFRMIFQYLSGMIPKCYKKFAYLILFGYPEMITPRKCLSVFLSSLKMNSFT